MAYENVRMVLEVNGEIIAEKMVRKYFNYIEEQKTKWLHMYPLKRMNIPYQIYIEIASEMQSQKRFKKDKQYIKHYESEK